MSEIAEEKARADGWVSKEEWKGDPEQWRPAEEFNERGEKINSILKAKIDRLEKETAAQSRVSKEVLELVRKEGYERAKKEFESKKQMLEEKQTAAVEIGDTKEFQKINKEISALKEPEQPKEEKGNPVFEEWNKKATWYAPDVNNPGEADVDLTLYANGVAADIMAKTPNIPLNELYEQVEKRVRTTFSAKFTNHNREKPNMTEGAGHSPSKTGSRKGWNDLPESAKSAYKKIASDLKMSGSKVEYTKEDYMKVYFEEE